ncbi:MAG: hypothetical protein GX549_06125 [Clostridiales bacterium]|nr:hypothetical protein [Clostridiales bacterium]
MRGDRVTAFPIAAAFAGTVMGAGFASGQELMQFFVVYASRGYWGLALAAALTSAAGILIMFRARRGGAEAAPRRAARLMNGAMALFLFGLLVVMTAGGEELLHLGWDAPPLLGGLLTAGLTAVTVAGGMERILKSFRVVVPVMMSAAAAAGIAVLIWGEWDAIPVHPSGWGSWTGSWLTASLLYVSYNMLAATAVLSPLGVAARGPRDVAAGAALGGGGLGLLALILCTAIARRFGLAEHHPLPMVALSHEVHPLLGHIYAVALFISIYTTAVGCLTGFMDRIGADRSTNSRMMVFAVCALALLGSRIGFARLVSRVYPISGIAGAVVFIAMAADSARQAVRRLIGRARESSRSLTPSARSNRAPGSPSAWD